MGRPVEIKIGNQYGLLSVVNRQKPNNHIKWPRPYWLCKCVCGNEKIVSGQFLIRSKNPSCGCNANGIIKNRKYNNPQTVTINSVRSSYKAKAKRRKLPWKISNRQFEELVLGNCFYCKSNPFNTVNVYASRHSNRHRASKEWKEKAAIQLNGIDRKDNTYGYIPNNCVSCCEICNKAKRDLSYDDFIQWINKLINNFGR